MKEIILECDSNTVYIDTLIEHSATVQCKLTIRFEFRNYINSPTSATASSYVIVPVGSEVMWRLVGIPSKSSWLTLHSSML